MNLQDVKVWTVSADHKARPKNPYVNIRNVYSEYDQFEKEYKDHTYACSPTLLPGDYQADDVELIWQVRTEKVEQTEKQKYNKSPLYGYRKPEREETNGPLWCRCTVPTLAHTLGIGPGIADCRRCGFPYYH